MGKQKTFKSTEEVINTYMPNYAKELRARKEDEDPASAGKALARRIMDKIRHQVTSLNTKK